MNRLIPQTSCVLIFRNLANGLNAKSDRLVFRSLRFSALLLAKMGLPD